MLSKDKRLSDHMLKLLVQLPRDFNLGPQQAWAMLRETMQQRLDGPKTASTSSGQLKHRNGSTSTCAVTPANVRAVIDKLKLNLRGSSSSSITAEKAAMSLSWEKTVDLQSVSRQSSFTWSRSRWSTRQNDLAFLKLWRRL